MDLDTHIVSFVLQMLSFAACTVLAIVYHQDAVPVVNDANLVPAIDARARPDVAGPELDMLGTDIGIEDKDMLVDVQVSDVEIVVRP